MQQPDRTTDVLAFDVGGANIKAADGAPITSAIYNTIHKVGPAK